jgi:hypothetical protein
MIRQYNSANVVRKRLQSPLGTPFNKNKVKQYSYTPLPTQQP